jgi:hypothetical protein
MLLNEYSLYTTYSCDKNKICDVRKQALKVIPGIPHLFGEIIIIF